MTSTIKREVIQGENLILCFNGNPMAANKSCTLKTTTEFIEVCSPESGVDVDYVPTKFSWELSANGLFVLPGMVDSLIDKQHNGEVFTIRFFENTNLLLMREGKVYISSMTMEGSKGSLAKFSVEFRPTGKLERVEPVLNLLPSVVNVPSTAYFKNELHKFYSLKGISVHISRLTLNSLSAVTFENGIMTDSYVIVCRGDVDVTRLEELISGHKMLEFYAECELAHISMLVKGHDIVRRMMDAGDYYIISQTGDSVRCLVLESLPSVIE